MTSKLALAVLLIAIGMVDWRVVFDPEEWSQDVSAVAEQEGSVRATQDGAGSYPP